MKRVNIDTATADVRQFIRGLPLGNEGIELELDGKIVCEIVPPHAVSDAERHMLISRARECAARARARNTGVPARTIEREVQQAVDTVRRRTQ
jgi:hypothetical protein